MILTSIAALVFSSSTEEAATLLRQQAHFPNMSWYTTTGFSEGVLENSNQPCWVGFTNNNMDTNSVSITILDGQPYKFGTKELQGFGITVYQGLGYQSDQTIIHSIDTSKDIKITAQNGERIKTLILTQQSGLVSSVTIQENSHEVTCDLNVH